MGPSCTGISRVTDPIRWLQLSWQTTTSGFLQAFRQMRKCSQEVSCRNACRKCRWHVLTCLFALGPNALLEPRASCAVALIAWTGINGLLPSFHLICCVVRCKPAQCASDCKRIHVIGLPCLHSNPDVTHKPITIQGTQPSRRPRQRRRRSRGTCGGASPGCAGCTAGKTCASTS